MPDTPKKTERVRKKELRDRKKRERQLFDKTMGPMPDSIIKFSEKTGSNTAPSFKQDAWERAPEHVVTHDIYDDEHAVPYFDEGKLKEMGERGSGPQSDDKEDQKNDLKRRHRDIWGKRGYAKVVVDREEKCGNPIGLRTIQNYLKEDREKGVN